MPKRSTPALLIALASALAPGVLPPIAWAAPHTPRVLRLGGERRACGRRPHRKRRRGAPGRTTRPTPAVATPTRSAPPATASTSAAAEATEGRLAALESAVRDLRAQPAPPTASAPPAAPATKPAAPAEPSPGTSPDTSTDFRPQVLPFDVGDLTWMPGNYGPLSPALAWGPFTGEIRVDTAFHYSLANPADNSISGSSEVFRHNEVQLTHLGFGGDFYYKGAHARLMTQFGLYSQTTPRSDPSTARGQWQLEDAYRFLSEAYAGYHFNVLAGLNLQAGVFMSFVGLWSYYNADNWTYQPSFVSSNTPWFFNGARVQLQITTPLKVELWLVNGWQSYGKFNQAPGVGLQVKWVPNSRFALVANQYYGTDTLGVPGRNRFHTDESVMVLLHRRGESRGLSMAAASLTFDAGCEWGDGDGVAPPVACGTQYFVGFMAYLRLWLLRDHLGLTVGGGAITNPGRYLVLIPPVNGATAATGSPYFTANPGDPFTAWDVQATFDVMPVRHITLRAEFTHRDASVPYWSGRGGLTPPGGNNGQPAAPIAGWSPDLVTTEDRFTLALLLRL